MTGLGTRISDATIMIEEKRELCVGTTSRMREGRAEHWQAGTHPGRTRRAAGYQGCAKHSREARHAGGAARSAAAAAQLEAAAGRVVPTCAPGGWWSGACLARGAG
jgi:hypothetical protein